MVALLPLIAQQNAGDQEPGQHEEQIDADPPAAPEEVDAPRHEALARGGAEVEQMEGVHREQRHAAHAVERRYPARRDGDR